MNRIELIALTEGNVNKWVELYKEATSQILRDRIEVLLHDSELLLLELYKDSLEEMK